MTESSYPDDTSFVRIQFDLPKKVVSELDDIGKTAGISTRKELFNNALTLLRWAIKQREQGKRIFVASADGKVERELSMPILDDIVPRVPLSANGA